MTLRQMRFHLQCWELGAKDRCATQEQRDRSAEGAALILDAISAVEKMMEGLKRLEATNAR